MKSVKITPVLLMALTIGFISLFSSCKKENSADKQQVSIYLTDDPTPFDAVNIDIRAVEVKVDSCAGHDDHFGDHDDDGDDSLRHRDDFGTWVSLNFTPGIYDVAQLRNGLETLLGSGTINGVVRKIRLTLGTNNTVVVSGTSYPLQLINPTGQFLYVRLNDRHRERGNNSVAIRIDFDLGRSIRLINGNYYLLPVLRPFCDHNFGQLVGKVLPVAASAVVKVYNSTDTATAIPNRDGYFKVRGLPSGTYNVLFDGAAPYRDTIITNVNLSAGTETRLPLVTLGQ